MNRSIQNSGLLATLFDFLGNGEPKQIRSWTAVDVLNRQAELRDRVRDVLGLHLWPERTPLAAQSVGVVDRDEYTIERYLIQSRPGFYIPVNLYIPRELNAPAPAILNPHGHFRGGKAGGPEPPIHPIGTVQPRLISLARLGFVVLALDGIGWGERSRILEDCGHWTLSPILTGGCVMGMEVWDNIRALDFLLSRREVDPSRVGITGASGGGTQTLFTAAVDERLKAIVPVCFGTNYRHWFDRELGLSGGICLCLWIPGLAGFAEFADICALLAPRATMFLCTSRDGCLTEGIAQIFPDVKRVFELMGAGDHLRMTVVEGAHGYFKAVREPMYAFFVRALTGRDCGEAIEERSLTCEAPEILNCFDPHVLPEDLRTVDDVVIARARELIQGWQTTLPTTVDEITGYQQGLRENLIKHVLGGFPERCDLASTEETLPDTPYHKVEFHSTEKLHVVGYLYLPKESPEEVVLVVDPEGGYVGIRSGRASRIIGKRYPQAVLAIDCQNWGSLYDPETRCYDEKEWGAYTSLLFVGHPLIGLRVWDVLRSVDFIREKTQLNSAPIHLIGYGEAGLVALLAAGLDERIESLTISDVSASFLPSKGGYGRRPYATYPSAQAQPLSFFLPGILRYGDIPQLVSLVAPRSITIIRPTTARREPLEPDEAGEAFDFPRKVYCLLDVIDRLNVHTSTTPWPTP
jgi:cephalosporin-C deacetylase-like acetyl esterase